MCLPVAPDVDVTMQDVQQTIVARSEIVLIKSNLNIGGLAPSHPQRGA